MAAERQDDIEPLLNDATRFVNWLRLATVGQVRRPVPHELGFAEWGRQRPGRRTYRVLRVPHSVAKGGVYSEPFNEARAKSADGVGTISLVHPSQKLPLITQPSFPTTLTASAQRWHLLESARR